MELKSQAKKLLQHSTLDALRSYIIGNSLDRFLAYYEKGKNTISFVAPEFILIQNAEAYETKTLLLESLRCKGDALITDCWLEGLSLTKDAHLLNHLLLEGEKKTAIAQGEDIVEGYSIPAGLYNFFEENGQTIINYNPDFGRGEHAEFFYYWIGTQYGIFTYFSFIQLQQISRTRSREIFDELMEAQLLSHRGHVLNHKELHAYHFNPPIKMEMEDALKVFLTVRPRRVAAREQFQTLLTNTPDSIRDDLRHLRQQHIADIDLEEFVNHPDINEEMLFQLFVEHLTMQEVAEQIIKNRGILKRNKAGDTLILLSDSVENSRPFYSGLMDYVKNIPFTREVKIAYRYLNPTVRNKQKYRHPMAEALKEFETRRTIEELEAGG